MSSVEKWVSEDGRRSERRIKEDDSERVLELFMEEERPLKLRQRVVEKKKNVVYEREIQTVDDTGNVIEAKVESCEPRVDMRLVDHIATVGVNAQSKDPVTREEMIDAIITGIKASRELGLDSQPVMQSPTAAQEEPVKIQNFAGKLQSKLGSTHYALVGLVGIIVLEVCLILYQL